MLPWFNLSHINAVFVFRACLFLSFVLMFVRFYHTPLHTVPDHHNEQQNLSRGRLYSSELVTMLQNGYSKADDRLLTDYILQRWIVGPSKDPLNLSYTAQQMDFSQVGQSPFVDRVLGRKTGGFYVECGAADGQTFSNSLFFEIARGWTGLLVEPNSFYFRQLLYKRRRAYSVNACLSVTGKTGRVPFKPAGLMGGLDGMMDSTHMKSVRKHPHGKFNVLVQCFSLYSIMLAIGRTRIDYLSLDVEGPEIDILNTIPFDKLYVDVLSVEYRSSDGKTIDEQKSADKLAKVREFFKGIKMYKEVGILPWKSGDNLDRKESRGLDVIFKRIENAKPVDGSVNHK